MRAAIVAILLSLAGSADAAVEVVGGKVSAVSVDGLTIAPNTVSASTVTITGTGTKCFSVDDPTFVVDCNLERVGIGTASPGTKLHMSSGTLTVDGTGTGIQLNSSTGEGTAGQAFIHLANAGYGAAGVEWIGNTGNLLGLNSPDTIRMHISNGAKMSVAAAGVSIGDPGTAIARIFKTATASTDLGAAITANCTTETNFSIVGVAVGDSCTVTTPAALAATDWVSCRTLLDNVALKYCSFGTTIDPAAMVYHITTIEY